MASLNRCTFIGNLTRDIELKYTSNGEAVANFSIACNESWKDKNGQKQEKVEYVNIVMYRKLAEIAGEYLKKGSSVYLEGSLQTRKWQKDGTDRYSTEVIASQMQMLGGKGEAGAGNNSGGNSNTSSQNNKAPAKPAGGDGFDDMDDDIPFS